MIWLRKNLLFGSGLAACALLALGELALLYERWAASREAAVKLVRREQELVAMRDVAPPPTRDIAKAIEADLARAQQSLAAMQAELKGRGPAAERLRAAKVPAARTDAYFDLATYVEKMRELARKHEVEIRPEAARFGFAAHANEGPETQFIEPVFRQRLIAQYLVEALLEAKPRALLALKREPPLSRQQREEIEAKRAEQAANGEPPGDGAAAPALDFASLPEGPDFFAIDRRASVRTAGHVDTTAFRVVFTGQTAALRTFLNRLATFELPVLVREVEVDPASAEEADVAGPAEDAPPAAEAAVAPSVVLTLEPPPAKKAAPRASAALPIVARTLSKFTVTVEYVDLVPPKVETPPGDPAPPPPS